MLAADSENQRPTAAVTKRYNTRHSKRLSNSQAAATTKSGVTTRRTFGVDITNKSRNTGNGTKKPTRSTRSSTQTGKGVTTRSSRRGLATRKAVTKKAKAAVPKPSGRVTRSTSRRRSEAEQKAKPKPKKKRKSAGEGRTERNQRKKSKTEDDENTNPNPVSAQQVEEVVEAVEMKVEEAETVEAEIKVNELVRMMDACDVNDPFALSEYAEEVYRGNRAVEASCMPEAFYMQRQVDITPRMRQKLIDWTVDLHKRFKLVPETLYLGINCLDRFLAKKTVYKNSFQLVGCTALLLASKYEEIYPPVALDFVYMSANAFTKDELLRMETVMLNVLGFNVTIPSILHFSQRFLKVVGVRADQKKIRHLVQYLMEFTLEHYGFVQFKYSLVAATAVYMACKCTEAVAPIQFARLHQYSGYELKDMAACLSEYRSLLAIEPRYKAVFRKFSDPSYSFVSDPTRGVDMAPAFEGLDSIQM